MPTAKAGPIIQTEALIILIMRKANSIIVLLFIYSKGEI